MKDKMVLSGRVNGIEMWGRHSMRVHFDGGVHDVYAIKNDTVVSILDAFDAPDGLFFKIYDGEIWKHFWICFVDSKGNRIACVQRDTPSATLSGDDLWVEDIWKEDYDSEGNLKKMDSRVAACAANGTPSSFILRPQIKEDKPNE